MDYIDRIIAVRVDADDTQRSLGKALDINYVQWANYERRFNEMPIRYLIKFCQHYGVSADYILGLGRDLKWPR
ncbi:helix-turn-helix transcriptional regulator [Oscillospiraceae bacterium 50-58]